MSWQITKNPCYQPLFFLHSYRTSILITLMSMHKACVVSISIPSFHYHWYCIFFDKHYLTPWKPSNNALSSGTISRKKKDLPLILATWWFFLLFSSLSFVLFIQWKPLDICFNKPFVRFNSAWFLAILISLLHFFTSKTQPPL